MLKHDMVREGDNFDGFRYRANQGELVVESGTRQLRVRKAYTYNEYRTLGRGSYYFPTIYIFVEDGKVVAHAEPGRSWRTIRKLGTQWVTEG